ncbi:gamma-glutamyl-gamma-aminobutyrate hydrolase family protein [Leucobacter sp. M11]|uniref:gamma-glutamyl-gamma-aminobutyrate hydrolase family protein n=1 Tax=Leucobacter sp. M11 TaxID=2993565 RepID=UPI002D7EA363|nr:gamma-glutamyl-gamma-aminobutyrate hydrolase family protein [Leucobacter sp. M11]MEB4614269.1 gamma-glutamyl-gamma-aminobutyrate hydrolase family protein [Leucobacter sp. M11]
MTAWSGTPPVIGITVWRRSLPTYLGERTDLYTLGVEYAERIAAAGGIPVLLSPVPEDQTPAILGRLDGLLLSGGQDLTRATRGLGPSPEEAADTDPARDAFERALLLGARDAGLPVLGICRGLQLTNVVLGGTLIEDLEHTEAHPAQDSPEAFLGDRHDVALAAGTALAAVYGVERRRVNTIHHQAVDRVAPGLVVAARADDGIIEAAESAAASWPFLGVQWHPEKLSAADEVADEARLFAEFVAQARGFAERA